jgi:hypothetical protein
VAPTRTVLPPTQTVNDCYKIFVDAFLKNNCICSASEEQRTDDRVGITTQHYRAYCRIALMDQVQLLPEPVVSKGSSENGKRPPSFLQCGNELFARGYFPDFGRFAFFSKYSPQPFADMRMPMADNDFQVATQGTTLQLPVA